MGSTYSRRNFLAGSLGLAVSACGENPIGRDLMTAFQYATTGLPGPEITRELVDAIPYASLAAKIGRGPRSLLVLWDAKAEGLMWLSADNVAIVTRNGRVVRTAGLPENLSTTQFLDPDPLQAGAKNIAANREPRRRLIDFEPDGKYGVEIVSTSRVIGPRQIDITSITFDTILIEERCRASFLNWSFSNKYWLDPVDGFVWRSEQHVSPNIPIFTLEVLKPAQS